MAVEDLKGAMEKYRRYFPGCEMETHHLGELNVGILWMGKIFLEFLSPGEGEETVSKFLKKRGEGLHHIAYRVDNIKEEVHRWEEAGAEVVNREPRIGLFQRKAVFLHPRGNFGVLIELVEGKTAGGEESGKAER
ncbi:MAG: VOC family protein [bacterium JZ-2024 1]